MKVVIIVPTYNEKGNIERLIPILEEKIFPVIKNHKMHVLVVDDNSPDGTADEVKKLMKKWDNISLSIGEKRGLGAAYVRGMNYATTEMGAEVMFEMDADLSHEPKKIPEFLEKIDEGYDLVIGTRYSGGGSIPHNWGLHRKLFSIFGNLLVRTILTRFWIHDWTGGFRALRKEVFLKEKAELTAFRGYTFQVSFLHKAIRDGFKITEVPIHFTDRTLGRSKIAPREYIADLLKYILKARFFEILYSPFFKYAITGFFGYLINAISLEVFKGYFGLHSGAAGALGAELAIIWNFTLNNFWAFSRYKITATQKIPLKFFQFNLVSFGSVLIIGGVITVGTALFGDTRFVRQLFLIAAIGFFVIPYSYSMYNIFIWKRWHISFLSRLQELVG
ncbi:MAG: glycosyltransferase family 2 protein [Candidatus Levybacteria bacterium]|nr:glycosyltransferase family 2 protein [Candidatus Levybacteria bacterium]